MARIQTAEKTFLFDLSESGEAAVNGIKFLDVAQIHNLVNRQSARQGFEYAVQSIEIGCQAGGAFTAAIYRLPEHWPCINAWSKTMILWKQQQDDAADEAGLESTRARYRDFKIHFDAVHLAAGFGANLIPNGTLIAHGGATDTYEWLSSQIVIPNAGGPGVAQEGELFMLGADAGAGFGMIHAYAESRSRPQQVDPNIVDVHRGGLFGAMFDVGTDTGDIIDNYQDRNHVPPYLLGVDGPDEYYPGASIQSIGPLDSSGVQHAGQLVDILSIGASQNFNSDTCPGFVAPCGLIKLEYRATGVLPASPATNNYQPAFWMRLVLAPGEYKGVLALPMQEVN